MPLSTGEYNLLHALVTRPRQVLTRDQLLDLTQGREAAAVEEHLRGCTSCAEALAAVKETVSALSGLHKVPAPPNFDREVAETIRRRSGGR